MPKQGDFHIEQISKNEEDALYGTRTQPVGHTFRVKEHLYLQRENDVLHLNTSAALLNTLHVGFLNEMPEKVMITYSEFVTAVKAFIYENDLNKFWG